MYLSNLTIENFRCFRDFELPLKPGLTALVGENDAKRESVSITNPIRILKLEKSFVELPLSSSAKPG